MFNNFNDINKDILIYILQIVTLYNAISLGWRIKKINCKTYELTKQINNIETFNFNDFCESIVSYDFIDKQ